jgi:hypothetical protein
LCRFIVAMTSNSAAATSSLERRKTIACGISGERLSGRVAMSGRALIRTTA